MSRIVIIALLVGGVAHAQTPAPAPQPGSPPSLLEQVKPLTDAYAEGLRACYGWPTAAGVWWCKFDQIITQWRHKQ